MRNRYPYALGAALLWCAASTLAQAPLPEAAPTIEERPTLQYLSVELLVFERTDVKTAVTALGSLPSYGGRQLMLQNPGGANGEDEPVLYTEAPSSSFRLTAAATRLNATPGLKVLRHLAWTQSTSTQEIRVDAASAPSVAGTIATSGSDEEATIAVDLAVGGDAEFFRLRQRQQIRLSAPVYFDHARFGAIALVSPVYETPPAVESAP
jgi:hypothetical protein